MSDLIDRQAAIDAFDGVKVDEKTEYDIGYNDGIDLAVSKLSVLPSATLKNLTKPNKSDLIVKGAGEIKDGLYNIKDGKLFQYKANGGTVRTYPIIEAGWIPCSERLPERDELVLVTYKTTDKIDLCKYLDDGSENSWWSYKDDCCAWNNVVIAWMPLPKAYREDGEEE